MAKTIHDLAIAYGKEHQGTVDIEVFEDGAKTVIGIIEKCFEEPSMIQGYSDIMAAVQEMKGV